MSIDFSHPQVYENLLLVIDEFEKQALRASTREGFLASAYAPLHAMNGVLDASEKSLTAYRSTEISSEDQASNTNIFKGSTSFSAESADIKFDADLNEVFGSDPDSWLRRYVEECLGCNLRLTAGWQLKPSSLLGPINGFLDQIKPSLDIFQQRLDPFNMLKDLCWALDYLKTLCLHDLLLVLLALKMLLKHYLTNTLRLKLDWTTLLGPLLKAIVQGISFLLDSIVNISFAPLGCSLNDMNAANRIYKESQAFLDTMKSIKNGDTTLQEDIASGQLDKHLDGGITARDTRWVDTDSSEQGVLKSDDLLGEVRVEDRIATQAGKGSPAFSYLTGFDVRADMSLADAFEDPAFNRSTFLEKLIVPIQDFRNFLAKLIREIQDALNSLENLVGKSLSLNLKNVGILLFIIDMISVVKLIIKMLSLNPGVKDWCKYLEENPEFLEQHLRTRFSNVRVTADQTSGLLVLANGPNIVGTISTCASDKSKTDNQLIAQWISELKSRGM